MPARALDRTLSELARAQTRFHVAAETRVVSCYEAGRDGSWLHHALEAHGVRNHVVDSSSIEVNRRQRRTKSDRLDARRVVALTTQLTVLERERTRLLKRGDSRRIGIVALARTLLVALEVYLRTGTVPKGAHVPLRDRCHR